MGIKVGIGILSSIAGMDSVICRGKYNQGQLTQASGGCQKSAACIEKQKPLHGQGIQVFKNHKSDFNMNHKSGFNMKANERNFF